jgi:hypothetical protein
MLLQVKEVLGMNSSQAPCFASKKSKKLNVDLKLVWSQGVLQMTD